MYIVYLHQESIETEANGETQGTVKSEEVMQGCRGTQETCCRSAVSKGL